jgi:hypothetical protein
MSDDPLAKWRKDGPLPETKDGLAVARVSGIRPREYKAFAADTVRSPHLQLRRGLIKRAEADISLNYAHLCETVSDGYGFGFSMTFARPLPWGPCVVEIRGEGLAPLLDGILNGTVKSIQLFDADRFLPPKEGDFDIEADEWRGPCVVKDITITEPGQTPQNTTRH